MNKLYWEDIENTYTQEVVYNRERICAINYITSPADIQRTENELRVSISHFFYTRDALPPVQYPENWLEAFKERWFPGWLLRKYPVRYKTVKVKECLMNYPVSKDPYIKMYTMETR